VSLPKFCPNPYEASFCQETHGSCERIVLMFFRFPGPGAVDRRARILTCFPCAGAHRVWRHHTRLEALSPPGWRVQRTMRGILCGLEILLCPRTGLFIRRAKLGQPASERQARGRGSPQHLCATLPRVQQPERVSNQRVGRREKGPRRTSGFTDAVQQDRPYAPGRLLPCVSSEAAGSPARLSLQGGRWA
jgi:hypothetical protein